MDGMSVRSEFIQRGSQDPSRFSLTSTWATSTQQEILLCSQTFETIDLFSVGISSQRLAFSFLLLLSGCGRSCTEIGCQSTLAIEVGKLQDRISKVSICWRGQCAVVKPADSNRTLSIKLRSTETVTGDERINWTVYNVEDAIKSTSVIRPKQSLFFPNGRNCPPSCVHLSAKIRRDGTPATQ
jgi:hypothetical protein